MTRWHTELVHRRSAVAAVALASLVALAGCSPITTVRAADGSTRTLTWAEYPGSAGIDADDVLSASDIDDIEAHAAALLDDMRDAIEEESGIRLEATSDRGELRDLPSNGYGGSTLLDSYNAPSLTAAEVPEDYDTWVRIYERISRLAEDAGAGPLTLEQDQEFIRDDPGQRAQFESDWATGVDGEYALLSAFTRQSTQFLHLTISDPTRRLAASDEEKAGGPMMSIDYGATIVPEEDRAEFERRLAPFVGAPKPDSSEWD